MGENGGHDGGDNRKANVAGTEVISAKVQKVKAVGLGDGYEG